MVLSLNEVSSERVGRCGMRCPSRQSQGRGWQRVAEPGTAKQVFALEKHGCSNTLSPRRGNYLQIP